MIIRSRPFVDIKQIRFLMRLSDWADSKLVTQFETSFAETIGVSSAFVVHQGRSALLLGLKSLGIRTGDEIIVQSLICQVVIDAILEIGAKPILVDNSLEDYQVSIESIKNKINSKTKAIIVAHLYGIPCNIEEINTIAKQNKCYLIEDCAHSLGALYNGKNVGTYGDLAIFSFNFDKPMSLGNGGILVVNNPQLINKVENILKQYKQMPLKTEKEIIFGLILQHLLTQKNIYQMSLSTTFGELLVRNNQNLFSMLDDLVSSDLSETEIVKIVFDYLKNHSLLPCNRFLSRFRKPISKVKAFTKRFIPMRFIPSKQSGIKKIDQTYLLMNSLRALIGLEQLKHLDTVKSIRDRNALYLSKRLDKHLYSLPEVDFSKTPAFLRYTVLNQTGLPTPDITELARDKGFEISNYNWANPVHLIRPYCRIVSHDRTTLRHSEQIAGNLLNIPIHFYVNEDDLEDMVMFLNSIRS